MRNTCGLTGSQATGSGVDNHRRKYGKYVIIAFVTLAWRFFMYYLPLLGLGIAFVMASRDAGRYKQVQEAREENARAAPAIEQG